MVRLTISLALVIGLSISAWAKTSADSTIDPKLQKLADNLRLKKQKLKEGEYEVRIWNKQGIVFGTAQMLYVLNKRQKSLTVTKYIIYSDENGFRRSIKLKPNTPATLNVWERLIQQNILTLPDDSAIQKRLHPPPPKDSTWNTIESDGSVSVHAKNLGNPDVHIGDGEGYYFEVFDSTLYRNYGYSNPRGYIQYKPNILELQNVVAILDEMALLFRSAN